MSRFRSVGKKRPALAMARVDAKSMTAALAVSHECPALLTGRWSAAQHEAKGPMESPAMYSAPRRGLGTRAGSRLELVNWRATAAMSDAGMDTPAARRGPRRPI
jgi:hypothetical protein